MGKPAAGHSGSKHLSLFRAFATFCPGERYVAERSRKRRGRGTRSRTRPGAILERQLPSRARLELLLFIELACPADERPVFSRSMGKGSCRGGFVPRVPISRCRSATPARIDRNVRRRACFILEE